jgi:hypothetical protein
MISAAAEKLKIDRIVELLTTVKATLSAAAPEHDVLLDQFAQSIDALKRLRADLERRVKEHGQLQSLDDKLRALFANKHSPEALATEWKLIKRARSQLKPPFADKELGKLNEGLDPIEIEIDEAIKQDEKQHAKNCLKKFSLSVGTAFREADRSLKDFCNRLSEVNQPLQALLSEC